MDIKENIKDRIKRIQEIKDHQELVKKIAGKGRKYEDSHAYRLGLDVGQAHLQNLLEQIEKSELKKE